MALIIPGPIKKKLAQKHGGVTRDEILECFQDRTMSCLIDTREDHATDPQTQWFIAQTFWGRKLKICFVETDEDIIIKTAYEPNDKEIRIYNKFAQPRIDD